MSDALIDADELAGLIARGAPVRVLDVRWRLDRPDGRAAFAEGHIPTAAYVDLDTELAAHGRPEDGRHPLPSTDALQAAARRWGIREGDAVVVYDDLRGMSAARAWWLLSDAGLDVRLLDGALAGWRASGGAIETGDAAPAPGDVTLASGRLARLDVDDAAALAADGVLFDVRAPERYRGEVEPIDPRAGHIPGARSLPTTGNLDADGRMLPPAQLRARALAAGAEEGEAVGVSCGSGVTASHAYLALHLAGLRPALYAGSWSQWANLPGRPVATGAERG